MNNEGIYNILVTGPPISGKTQLANKLEKDLISLSCNVVNKDIDYSQDWNLRPKGAHIYILQTPHGSDAEKEDGINFTDFQRILYMNPDDKTYKEFLSSRGTAWFKEGIVETTEDFKPKPYSLEKLPKIFEKIIGYASKKHKIIKDDFNYFKEKEMSLDIIVPIISGKGIYYKGYEETLDEILKEVRG